MITLLNFSSSNQKDIVRGMEYLGIMRYLENLIKNVNIPLVIKSAALLAVSNMYVNHKGYPTKLADSTKDFAICVLS